MLVAVNVPIRGPPTTGPLGAVQLSLSVTSAGVQVRPAVGLGVGSRGLLKLDPLLVGPLAAPDAAAFGAAALPAPWARSARAAAG